MFSREQFRIVTEKERFHMTSQRQYILLFQSSSSLKPGTKGFTCGKWLIGYNFGIDDAAELKFGTLKKLIVLNILKYKYCV